MSEPNPQPAFVPPVSTFAGPVGELIAQRMLLPPSRPGLLAMLDHFEILRVLGGGGMGVVLLARDSDTGRDVAIKLVRTDLATNQHVVHRFLKEAGHLKRLQHTNIVPVLEVSARAESPYFVMPFFEQGSLANRIKPGQPLDTETILDIATQIAEGLGFAHRSGIIHRDLKPANILLGAKGQVCLADFGLARTVFNDTIVDVESRHLEGTAPYMSPAVAAGNAEDTRCDIYSFGALLYEMLTGQPPYQGRGTKEILDQIIVGPPKPITSVNPAADRRLVAVAERALARELRDRYAEMRDVLSDLHRIRDGKQLASQRNGPSPWFPVLVFTLGVVVVIIALAWMLSHRLASTAKPLPPAATAPVIPAPTVLAPPVTPPTVTPPVVVPPPDPKVIPLAGQMGVGGYADGTGAQAQFRLPNNVAADRAGNVYVADTANNVIRKITAGGVVTTLAGLAGSHGSADGIGAGARFWAPFGVAVDTAGNVYVADTANNAIRKISPDGNVTTLAGSPGHPGSIDGTGRSAEFRNPWDVAVDASGNILVADMSNDTIRKITPGGVVTTLAGHAGETGTADGFATNARFNDPFAVTVDSAGNAYVSDSANQTIRKITPGGTVVTLAGLAGYAGNNDGNASTARFWNPQGIAVDASGNVYVADTGNNTVRKISPTGVVSTLPELAAAAGNAPLNNPGGLAVDNAGNLYVADTNDHCIRKIRISK
jgi:serine/threonine protein kinase/sugar lactone lactonase YvrE